MTIHNQKKTNDAVGILLLNLGTPDAPDSRAVRRYLGEFLADRRVVEIPPLFWLPILYGVILPFRSKKSAHAYKQIWWKEGSPLAVITQRQAEALSARYNKYEKNTSDTPPLFIEWAMRYGQPSVKDGLQKLRDKGCSKILIAPLYPQFSGATTASAHDAVFNEIQKWRYQPALHILQPYYEDDLYIDALSSSLTQGLEALDYTPDRTFISYHGMPERTFRLGDPYYNQCLRTSHLLEKRTGLKLFTCFQSRFGPEKWLEPSTNSSLARAASEGAHKVAIITPGFSADCLETLEEINIGEREQFLAAGGKEFAYIECLNDSNQGMDMLQGLIDKELCGWIGKDMPLG